MEHEKSEVLGDFLESVKKIELIAYNPDSREFERTLRIGLMWKLLCDADGTCVVSKEVPQSSDEMENDDISEEISGAKKYLQKYIDSGDSTFREMASDELRHASILIKKANAKLPGADEKKRLKEYESEIGEIQKQVV